MKVFQGRNFVRVAVTAILLFCLLFHGCVGALVGAATGGTFAAGASHGNPVATVTGTIVGAVLGHGIEYMIREQADIEKMLKKQGLRLRMNPVPKTNLYDEKGRELTGISILMPSDDFLSQAVSPSGEKYILPSDYGRRAMDIIVREVNKHSSFSVNIYGHSDSVGNARSNMILSEKRAIAVAKYFNDCGVSRVNKIEGLGATVPVVSNETPEGRAMNRRIEILILDGMPVAYEYQPPQVQSRQPQYQYEQPLKQGQQYYKQGKRFQKQLNNFGRTF